MNLSFAGCGFLGIYHVGVAVCFKKYAPHLLLDKISGASAGAIAACCLLCDLPLAKKSRDTVVSRAKYRTATARHSGYLYASRIVESISDYQTSITAKPIEFLIGLIDSLGLNYIRKVFLFTLYMIYKQRH